MRWVVIEEHDPPPEDGISHTPSSSSLSVADFDISSYHNYQVLCSLFIHLAFTDWREKVDKLKFRIKESKAKVKQFSRPWINDWSAEFAQIGKELFKSDDLTNICTIPALKTSGVSSQRFGFTWS
jgi:hypothetical protein